MAVVPTLLGAQTLPKGAPPPQPALPLGGMPSLLLGRGQFNCTIKPLRVVEVTAPVNGVASRVLVRPGMRVEKGAVLVELDSDLAAAEERLSAARAADGSGVRAAEIRRDGLARRQKRLEEAYGHHAISAADFEEAETDLATAINEVEAQKRTLELAAIDLERARIALAKTRVIAPVSGIVGEDLIDPGEGTTAGPVATIYVNQPLRVEAYVPSSELAQFVAATEHTIVVDDDLDHPQPVHFDYAAQLADLASGTISVFFTLDAPKVLPGSKCLIAGGATTWRNP